MQLRQLGRTELMVSAVGMGGIPIQRINAQQAVEVLDAAIAGGVNFIDTARAYTDSEAKLGNFLSQQRHQVLIATKSMARSQVDMAADIQKSLQALQVEKIDLYQLHNVKDKANLERVLAEDGALAALKEAQQQGKIRYIGITGHIPDILVEAIETGSFDTVQFPYNPMERGGEELLALAKEMNIGTIAMKPFAGGAIKNNLLSLRYILDHGFSTVIPGMDDVSQVQQNIQAGTEPRQLTSHEMADLLEEAADLGETFCRRCEYCMPCPKNIDIPTVFLLEGYWSRYGLQTWARERYQPLGAKAEDCIQCGECEAKCPYSLPIRELLKSAGEKLG